MQDPRPLPAQPLAAPLPAAEIHVEKIWSHAPHNAFTDLARFEGSWYCTFRESREHARGAGRIRVLRSADGNAWESCALLSKRGLDLRDPKLSVTPAGNLMLLVGGTRLEGGRPVGRRPLAAFSSDGATWPPFTPILDEGDWLWRVAWHEGRAYGVTYRLASPHTWTVSLVESEDGTNYEELCALGVPGKPNEATVRFAADSTAVMLLRREGADKMGWVGSSHPPYRHWTWSALAYRLGGPNFLILPGGGMWAATRILSTGGAKTVLGRLAAGSFEPLIELPSGGDCGYPGMVWHRGRLWMSYYSSHEGRPNIYLARTGGETLAQLLEAASHGSAARSTRR